MLLRSAMDENLFDQRRHKLILLSQEETMKKYISRIESLENFIIEQDEVSSNAGHLLSCSSANCR